MATTGLVDQNYDAIIVGARIAGSATALGLAARGWRVLLLDAATFPSDTLSTHLLWSDALAGFDRLGVLDAVLAVGAPALTRVQLAFGDVQNSAPIPTRPGYPPLLSVRRIVLDDILARRAGVAAGVTLREGSGVEQLCWEHGRVSGVRGVRRATGERFAARAPVVVGADGRHSLVARQVNAAAYDVVPPLLATYYRYYRGVPPLTPPALEAYRDVAGGFCYLFPCDGDLWTLAVAFPQADFAAVRQDHERQLAVHLARKPGLLERLAGAEPAGPWRGAGDLANFLRVPYGPGWALAGDAGYHRDPITARGISDALLTAELLAAALDRAWRGALPYGEALHAYQLGRDAAIRPLYDFTVDRPPAGVAPTAWSAYLARAFTDPDFLSVYIGFMAAVTPPSAFYTASAVLGSA
ncbi:MAG TPA: NAD(P)/FAD-dependent oxidoreductase [Thermomicrobiales bacterium]|nr:NAD(P)/FAD-dependent oxidoreductase [Thermomicrobiales bacterium]